MEKASRPSETLSQRVRRTLEDLASIRELLQSTIHQGHDANTEANPVLDLNLAAELKRVVDALRELLWDYITALSAESGRRPQEVLGWYKTELAVDLLSNPGLRPDGPTTETPVPSVFEELMTAALAVTAMHAGQERRV